MCIYDVCVCVFVSVGTILCACDFIRAHTLGKLQKEREREIEREEGG